MALIRPERRRKLCLYFGWLAWLAAFAGLGLLLATAANQ